jgi:hypothetical protein
VDGLPVRRRDGRPEDVISAPPYQLPDRVSGYRAGAINAIIDYCRSLSPIGSRYVSHTWRPDGVATSVYLPPPAVIVPPWGEQWAFGIALKGVSLTVYAGTLSIDGKGDYATVETALTLVATTEWVYLKWLRGSGGITVEQTTSRPSSSSTAVAVPLYRFDQAGGTAYKLALCCHIGDVHLGAPL